MRSAAGAHPGALEIEFGVDARSGRHGAARDDDAQPRLQRVRIMHIHLGDLGLGRWRELTPTEVQPLLPPERKGRATLRLRKRRTDPAQESDG